MQSILRLQGNGTAFFPANPIELIANYTNIPLFVSCYTQCNMNSLCRTFVSDTIVPFVCRLYEGSIDTGQIIISSSLTSRVAGLIYDTALYINYNYICNSHLPPSDRYLICVNGLWQCPIATFWNGSMCLNQVYYQDSCNSNEMCRQDIGLQCLSSCYKCVCNSSSTWNSTSCVQSVCPSVTSHDSTLAAFWSLDGDARDLTNTFNGTLEGNASFVTGYIGQALQCSYDVYVQLSYIDFYHRSFTIELWFYRPIYIDDDMILFSECANVSEGRCLHCGISRESLLYMGFYQADSEGSTIIVNNQWYHVAFVYDYTRRQRLIYLNGILEMTNLLYAINDFIYDGQFGNATICKSMIWSPYRGYIDQVSITYRAKSASEVLDDASLVAYYSFDCGSTLDSGPNLLHGNATGQVMVTGRVNDALLFSSINSYFQASDFFVFGTANQSFSISFWMKPLNLSGILIHLSNQSTGDGWCIPLIGFNSLGSLVSQWLSLNVIESEIKINVWTHVVQMFSVTNGLQLYINGTLHQSSLATTDDPPNQPMYISIASPRLGGSSCMWGAINPASCSGAIDELRIYNREITTTEICQLSS